MAISETAAFTHALLIVPAALRPRSIFRRYFALTDAPFSPGSIERVESGIESCREREKAARGQQGAFFRLLARDAEAALGVLQSADFSNFNVLAQIDAYYDVAEKYYRDHLHLPWTRKPPRIVCRYPAPAQEANWFAVSSVPGGPRPGYPEGIYFLKRHMMPGVVDLATLHENAHHIGMGSKGRGGYIRYFDEGCCNMLAYLVHFHRSQETSAITLYRTFLQEINTELYEYPSFDRIIASIIVQIGLAGLYRLLVRRLKAPESIDWRGILRVARAGELRRLSEVHELQKIAVPPILEEMQQRVHILMAEISSPDPVQMSPVAYLAFDHVCENGSLSVEELEHNWELTSHEVSSIVEEVEGMDLWVLEGARIKPSGRSELFRNTGLIRASTGRTTPWADQS